MHTVKDSKGRTIKAGSLVKSKNSNIIREVLSYTDGSIVTSFNSRIRALRIGSHHQDWTFLKPSNVEVVD